MEVLAEIVRNILVIIILTSFMELLLPEGKQKPFVRFAIGLFILIAVLTPILNAVFSDRNLKINLWNSSADYYYSEEIIENGAKIQELIQNSNQEVIKEKIQGQINAMALMVPGVKEVNTEAQVDDEGTLEKVLIVVTTSPESQVRETGLDVFATADQLSSAEMDKEAVQNKIQDVIHNFYGFNKAAIEIKFEGG